MKPLLAAILVLPILAASHVQALRPTGQQASRQTPSQALQEGKADWFGMRTRSAEQQLIAATKSPATAAEAHYWLGRIYDFKGNKAEGAFPGFHEQVSYRARAETEFKAAGMPRNEWIYEAEAFENSLKTADALIGRIQADPRSSFLSLYDAIERRIKLRPDPIAYISAANILLGRNVGLPYVLDLAAEGRAAGERFIRENEDSYKLDGKVQASIDRNAATFADIAGWALFLQGDLTGAEARLSEAARLFRNNDLNNQLHLAELSARRGDLSTAEDHYLNVVDLAAANFQQTGAQRSQAMTALFQLRASSGESAEEAKRWLNQMLERKRDQRRESMTGSMLGRELPALKLKDLQGNDVDLRAQHGNVVLLGFFAAW